MDALVGLAAREFILTSFGPASWALVRAGAQVPDFGQGALYEDIDSAAITESAAAFLNRTQQEALEAFGEFWSRFVARPRHAAPAEFSLDLLVVFLEVLEAKYGRARFNSGRPFDRAFEISNETDGRFWLHYHNGRPDLSPLIIGLIHGLDDHFSLTLSAQLVEKSITGHDHAVFEISFRARHKP